MIVRTTSLYEPALAIPSVAWRLGLSVVMTAAAYLVVTRGPLSLLGGIFVVLILAIVAMAPGLPLYLAYRRLGWRSPWSYALGAALIAAALYALPDLFPSNPSFGFSYGNCLAVVAGERTPCGWGLFAEGVALYLGLGAVAGVLFWVLLRLRART